MHLFTRTSARRRTARGIALAVATSAALLLAACATPGGDETPNATDKSFGTLEMQLSWVKIADFAGEYFAVENGYFEEAGFDTVNLIPGPGPTPAIVASGQALVGISDPTRVAPAIANEGAPVKIIAAQFQKTPFSILSLADKADIDSPEDLIGKRIGIQTGNEPLFYALLEANDISRDDVTIVPVEYDPSPVVTGDVDGFLAYVNVEAIVLRSQGHDITVLPYADNGLPLVAKTLVVSQDSIDNNREALKAFLWANIRGWLDAIADPDEGARLAVDKYGADLGLDLAVETEQLVVAVEDLTVSDETRQNGLFTISDELMKRNIEVLNSIGIQITADELFDMSLLKEVYDEHPELRK